LTRNRYYVNFWYTRFPRSKFSGEGEEKKQTKINSYKNYT